MLQSSAASESLAGLSERVDELPFAVRLVLTSISVGGQVPSQELAEAFGATALLAAPIRDVVLGSLMTAVMMRGPHVDDVVAVLGSALAVDRPAAGRVIGGEGRPVVLLAGSGKKGVRTLNVSTPAALVAAVAGAKVIKVGSAATSSALGSRDLVRALGLRERRTEAGVREDLAARGFAFVAIEPEIPLLDRIYGGRFHVPNPFSFGLAPLVSPVRGDVVVFGLSHPRVDVAAEVLARLGMRDVEVLTTCTTTGHFIDEIGPAGEVLRCSVVDGTVGQVQRMTVEEMSGRSFSEDLPTPSGPQEAVDRTIELLGGIGLDSHRVLVGLNAAHLLTRAGISDSFADGFQVAEEILRSGAPLELLSGTDSVTEAVCR